MRRWLVVLVLLTPVLLMAGWRQSALLPQPQPQPEARHDDEVRHDDDEPPAERPTSRRVGPDDPLDGPAARLVRARGFTRELAVRARRLLAAIDAAMRETGLDYVLTDGALLGLCRGHANGWIEWDDDIDVLASREQFDDVWHRRERTAEDVDRHADGLEMALRRRGVSWAQQASGLYKLFFTGSPRAKDRPWGYPFVDLFLYESDPRTGDVRFLARPGTMGDPMPLSYILPSQRVTFPSSSSSEKAIEVSIPNKPGWYLDKEMPGWRHECVVTGYSHAIEGWEPAGEGLMWISGSCRDVFRLRGISMPPEDISEARCPSSSSRNRNMHGRAPS